MFIKTKGKWKYYATRMNTVKVSSKAANKIYMSSSTLLILNTDEKAKVRHHLSQVQDKQDYLLLQALLHSWLKPSELRNVPVIKRDIYYRLKLKVCSVKVYSTASLNQDNDSTFSLPESRKEVNLQLILQEDHHYCAPNIKSEKGWSGIQSDKPRVDILREKMG